jgi:hypothetical protein
MQHKATLSMGTFTSAREDLTRTTAIDRMSKKKNSLALLRFPIGAILRDPNSRT